jgi:putative transposase
LRGWVGAQGRGAIDGGVGSVRDSLGAEPSARSIAAEWFVVAALLSHFRATLRPCRSAHDAPNLCGIDRIPNEGQRLHARKDSERNPRPRVIPSVTGVEDHMPRTRRNTLRQLTIFPRGGKQRGAGRKPKGAVALAPHDTRPRLTKHDPVLVTTHLLPGLPSLRRERTLVTLRRAFAAGAERFGFRLVEFSIQSTHLHFLAEGDDARAVSRGMQGLLVRVAKALNREWGRKGTVLSDRYHARILGSPRAVRNALVYVLQNAKKHGARITGIDAFTSGPWFAGWVDRAPRVGRPIARAGSWLLRSGWQRGGLLRTTEAPALAE